MRRTRRMAKIVESSDSEDNVPLKKLHQFSNNPSSIKENDSSSESDIENYLQPIDKIDLNSSFFNTQKKNEEEFNKIEKELFAGITRLSDSDSDDVDANEDKSSPKNSEQIEVENNPSTSGTKLNFKQLEEYTRQIEEAKKHIEKYNAKKKASKKIEENNLDISNLLAVGESKQVTLEDIKLEDLHSSDFESGDSEREDWEEVKIKDYQETKEHNVIRKQDIQIVVNMPDSCRKKKGVDLLAAMKRRLNRIRKENQVYVHKVHLLCWIAHGNYVNAAINNTEILGLALSLLPSDKCYPSERTDLSYLEQIVQWYKKAINLVEKPINKKSRLVDILKLQISKKDAYNKNMFVYIFIAILRALGIQCRLVLSFQVESLRPPASELHSLRNDDIKKEMKNKSSKNKTEHNKSLSSKESKQSGTIKQKKDNNALVIKTSNASSVDKCGNSYAMRNKEKKGKSVNEDRKSEADNKLNNNTIKKDEKKNVENKNKSTNEKGDMLKVKETRKRCLRSERNTEKETIHIQESNEMKKKLKNEDIKIKEKGFKNTLDVKETKSRSKSESNSEVKASKSKPKNNSKKDVIKIKFPKREKIKGVPQVDGTNNSSDEEYFIKQLDGADDKKEKPKSKKPNLKKLRTPENACDVKKHPNRLKTLDKGYNSEDDFQPRNSIMKKNTESPKVIENRKVNLNKLKNLSKKRDQPKTVVSPPQKQLNVKDDIINLIKGRIVEQKQVDRSRMVKKRKPPPDDSDSDSDFMPEPIKKKHHHSDSDIDYFVPKPKVKQRIRIPRKGSDLKTSTDSDLEKTGKKKGNNVWAEVFLEAEEKWISVDVVRGQVHCVNELFTRATHPISYIVAWNNNNNIKDITKRYCTNFNTITRKLRVDAKWWDETLKPFLGKYTARDKEEDDDLNRQQLDQPLPKSVAEYKNHPLYALRRHLLKFEDIYPPDVQPLGFIRGEAVYPRNCVYVCRSRDIWLKEAKVVKLGEQPYKIVKARPKYDKLSNKIITDQLLEIFGEWQTTDYEPPTAQNGEVPRNAFGNVELFKPCMLPKGTVHLKLPGLNKVCRKMNIDCASAIVGFDFHGGWSHPMYDGFVVCEEFVDAVVAAWESEQEEIEKKENEKIEKRVYGNWKKLIKGLLIRERLKAKYDFGEASTSKESKEKKPKGPRFCTKKR
ncbi:DNA repair protein complementing XP-C cells homolog [Anoplophora glabripennis]|nr:DNA repair protein complementing XP-C cells homolog [Anoplophora glabripennis]